MTRRTGTGSALVAALLAGCAGAPRANTASTGEAAPAPPASAGSATLERPSAEAPNGAPAGVVPSASTAAAAPAPNAAVPVAARVSAFPLPNIVAPSAKTAAPGDGVWAPFGDAALGERAARSASIVRTVVHPHPGSKYVTVTIAAVDLTRVGVRLVAGTEDLLWAKLTSKEPAGLVPAAEQERLLAVMNGGFQPKHGHWGLLAGGNAVAPPRDEGCTLALYRDETVRLAPWSQLSETAAGMASFRQTPPCLLDGGALHPALLKGDDKRWAGHAADLTTRRRSAVGLRSDGRVLFYAMGEEAGPRWLAEALHAAGADVAAELDINWYWTRFLLFGQKSDEPLHVTSTLIPKMEHQLRGYVARPSTRDFFYFVERP